MQHLAGEIKNYHESLDFEPGQLEDIEARLHIINRLKAKYGKDIEEVLGFLYQARQELLAIKNTEQIRQEYEVEIEKLEQEYDRLAARLTKKRKIASRILQEQVLQELVQLNMPDTQFAVAVTESQQSAA